MPQVEEEELPALELIEDNEVSPNTQLWAPNTDFISSHTLNTFILLDLTYLEKLKHQQT